MGNQATRLEGENDVADLADGRPTASAQAVRSYYANAPLTFHPIHGTCIRLSDDMTQASRYQSFCNGLCFSSRPVAVGERINITCLRSSESWSGSIRIGFTTWDPSNFDSSLLPRYSCPDLANHAGFWVKALPENTMTKANEELVFYYNKIGTVFFGLGQDNLAPLICGLETTKPLWAIVDVYGNTIAVSIKSSMRGSKSGRNSKPNSREGLPPEVLRLASVDSNHSSSSLRSSNVLAARSFENLSTSPYQQLPGEGLPPAPAPARSQSLVPPSSSSNSNNLGLAVATRSPSLPPLSTLSSVPILRNVTFSTKLGGRNVSLTQDCSVAMRRHGEFCNAYVFTSRPIPIGTKVAVQIVSVTSEYRGGLTFGITAADLSAVNRDSLPNNSDDLLDRTEYWVVNKDVCTNPSRGDELVFSFVPPGAIQISRNNQLPSTLMYVDGSLSLTFFFDLYGSIESIRLLGTIDPSYAAVVSLPPENANASRNVTQQRQIAQDAAARAVARTSPPRPPPPTQVQLPAPAPRQIEQIFLSDPPSTVPPQLPPPLVPVQVPPAPPVAKPPPIPARPNKAPLNPNTTTAKPGETRQNPPKQLLQPPGVKSTGNNMKIITKDTSSPTTGPINSAATMPTTPSAATLDAFRQNAQNVYKNAGNDANNDDDALLSNECTVCLAAQVDCALYSCGHLCLCFSCAQAVRKADNLCPICRQPIKDVIKVFKC